MILIKKLKIGAAIAIDWLNDRLLIKNTKFILNEAKVSFQLLIIIIKLSF